MRKLTPASLRRAAEHHVERHPVSAEGLRRVLERKIAAHVRRTGEPAAPEVLASVTTIVTELVALGFVDDRRLAEARSRTMRRRGKSLRAVEASLRTKRVAPEVVASVIASPHDELGAPMLAREADLEAARNLVRRKKLGPNRPAEERAEHRARDLAALARAGFSYELARRVLDASPNDE